jgi:NAD(P)-dependent dehydrogenase (short-subunit alcohol dehydrogenase family)
MDDLTSKVAVVVGASSRIGFALAKAFAAEGMRVVLADVDVDNLKGAVDGSRAQASRATGALQPEHRCTNDRGNITNGQADLPRLPALLRFLTDEFEIF